MAATATATGVRDDLRVAVQALKLAQTAMQRAMRALGEDIKSERSTTNSDSKE